MRSCSFISRSSGRYGFHRDELYYVAAGRHPAAGYVDQPPLVPLLARAITAVFGDRLWPLRAVAGSAHAALVVVAGRLARELGGHRWAEGVAAVATAAAPVFVATGGLFQTVVFDQLWWAVALLLVVRLQQGADPRLWLVVGAVVGLGLESKWTMALLGAGLGVGYVVTAEGRVGLRSDWPWPALGVAVAGMVWAPNLLWQALNGWPTLEFTQNNNADVHAEDGRLAFVVEQFALVGPLAVPLVVAGLSWCWHRPRWRFLFVAAVLVFAVLAALGGKSYYLAPLYVVLFAAGGVAVEGRYPVGHIRGAVPIALVAAGLLTLPLVAPVLPPSRYVDAVHDVNDELGEELGWPELADQVAAVYAALPSGERRGARIVTASYGEAAALDIYGPARGIPRGSALSAHNSYRDWWPDRPGGDERISTVVGVRYQPHALAPHCGAVERMTTINTPFDVDNEIADTPITLCRDLLVTSAELREALAHLE